MALTRSTYQLRDAELLEDADLDLDPFAGEDEDWDAEDYLYPPAADGQRASFSRSLAVLSILAAAGWLAFAAATFGLFRLFVG
jgi:hypothetical protein